MKNVMFIGKMCSGKTTCADTLCEAFGYKRLSLASPIKLIIQNEDKLDFILGTEIFPYLELSSAEQGRFREICKHSFTIPSKGPKYRERLQWLGTDGIRKQIDDKTWINLLLNRVSSEPDTLWAVDDVRFVNEYQMLASAFVPMIVLVKPATQILRITNLYGEFEPSILTHASEMEFELIRGLAGPDVGCVNGNLPLDAMKTSLLETIKGLN